MSTTTEAFLAGVRRGMDVAVMTDTTRARRMREDAMNYSYVKASMIEIENSMAKSAGITRPLRRHRRRRTRQAS